LSARLFFVALIAAVYGILHRKITALAPSETYGVLLVFPGLLHISKPPGMAF
jgi:hypothetical protein